MPVEGSGSSIADTLRSLLGKMRSWENIVWHELEKTWKHWATSLILVVVGLSLVVWATVSPQSPGISIGLLATAAGIMSLRTEFMHPLEKIAWIVVLVFFAILEVGAIHKSNKENAAHIKKIVRGINSEIDIGKQNLAISNSLLATVQTLSRQLPTATNRKAIINAWGAISQLNSKAVQGAVPTLSNPPSLQKGRRVISAESLGLLLKSEGVISSATIINDGTVEAGNFAQQLGIGLQMAGWQVGGDNIKMGDPQFFPDSLTLEVSASPASASDNSIREAKSLQKALEKQGIDATLRLTELQFPPNFMRIKVSGQ